MSTRSTMPRWIAAAGSLASIVVGGRAGHEASKSNPAIASAWAAWNADDLEAARSLGEKLTTEPATRAAGHHILALVAHVSGRYAEAIAQQAQISPRYRRLSELDEPILWSYIHAGDLKGALEFARRRGMSRTTLKRLQLAIRCALSVRLDDVTVVPFTDDALSQYMPGFEATFCGRRAVVRLDTGGTFVHLSAAQAAEYSVKTVGSETAFGSLTTGRVGYGVADELKIGRAVLRNVPVVVHHGALATEQVADALGVAVGPIIGTNVLEQLLTTIDGPGRRLILSPRGDEQARARHLALCSAMAGRASEVPFALWLDHYMLVQGRVAGQPARFFVDSGLVAATPSQGQASLLASRQKLADWGASATAGQTFPEVPGLLCIGDACREPATAFPVDDSVWHTFGDWGHSRVDALVSWGFLSHFVWTLDFDSHTYTLIDARQPAGT